MTQEIRHTVRQRDNSTVLLAGEIAYADSNTIKVGDGEKTFAQLPSFASNNSLADNSTMSTDASNKLQVLGTVNKNSSDSSSVVFDWIGTTQQYTDQQIATAHPDWLCFITDDLSGGSASMMYTKAEIDAFLSDKADGQGAAVMVSGDQSVEGNKTFLNSNIRTKSTQIDSTATPAETEYLQNVMAFDKNGKRISCLETYHHTDGTICLGLNACVNINGSNVYSPVIKTCISQDGQTKWTDAGQKPTSTYANDNQIATTSHVMDVLKAIYPVGAIYIGTQSTCPMSAFFGTWSLVSSGRALWTGTGSNGNTTIAAGLPNITGDFAKNEGEYHRIPIRNSSGAFTAASGTYYSHDIDGGWYDGALNGVKIDASRSSSIYGNSTTVQPPAYVVNVWRRTA